MKTKSKARTTESVLAEMLKENTGEHFLDSGGAYGRAWQRNQGRDFINEPGATIAFSYCPPRPDRSMPEARVDIDFTQNIFHFLFNSLSFDAKMNDKFVRFCKREEDMYGIEAMEAFWDYLRNKGHKVGGIYGEDNPFIDNSYNHECNLSQTIQFGYAQIDGEPYVFLQVHGGCDVRGGYTDVKVFTESDDTAILRYADGNVGCEKGHSWYTDDDSHWYPNDDAKYTIEGLFGTETITIKPKQLEEYTAEELGLDTEKEYSDQPGFCPLCLQLPGKERNEIKG